MNSPEALKLICRELTASGILEAQRESQLILSFLLDCPINMLPFTEKVLDDAAKIKLNEILAARKDQQPLQYILGETDFMGLTFQVSPDVLIPRGDTERIVEAAISLLKKEDQPLIADICCGSGNIAVSLAYYLPVALIFTTDISEAALKIAQKNADFHHLTSRIRFLCGDLLEPVAEQKTQLNMIISNPPYIKSKDLHSLQAEVQKEPRLALDGGPDGLDYYRRLAQGAFDLLLPQGYLLLETGFEQKNDVTNLLRQHHYKVIDTISDYGGNHRGIVAQKP